MTLTNNQFSTDTISLLKSLEGKSIDSISHEPFFGPPTSYGMVYLSIDKKRYVFKAYEEPMYFFGVLEDISKARFEIHNGPIESSLVGVKFVTDKVRQKISGITLVSTEEIVKEKKTGEEYAFFDTLGIIFTLEDGTQLSLIKGGIFETISIYRGHDPKSKIQKLADNYLGDFDSEDDGKSGVYYTDL